MARRERQATTATSAEVGDEVEGAAPVTTAAEKALDGDARELFDARETRCNLCEAVVPQRLHVALERCALDLLARRVSRGERCKRLGHHEQLVDADPALVARLVAARAALLAVERHAVARGRDVGRDASGDHLVDRRRVHLTAMRAELPCEALCEHARDGGAG